MGTVLTIIFIGFVVTFVSGNLMIFAFKKPEASFKDMFLLGSFIVRDLDRYVEAKRVPQVNLLLKIGATLFCLWVLVGVGYGLSQRF